jgi:hypothetical protein
LTVAQDDIRKYSSPSVTLTADYRNILTKKMESLQVVNSVHVKKIDYLGSLSVIKTAKVVTEPGRGIILSTFYSV